MATPETLKRRMDHESWEWQTRVVLRSNEGDGYEIDRQVLIDGRYVIAGETPLSLLTYSGFFKNLFEVAGPPQNKKSKADLAVINEDASTANEDELSDEIEPALEPEPARHSIVDEDLDIDACTNDLRLFADFMQHVVRFNKFVQAENLEIDLKQAVVLLALTDKYDCVAMHTTVRTRLARLAQTAPWDILYLACGEDDLWLGQIAISHLSNKLIHTLPVDAGDNNIWKRLAPLSYAWQIAFLKLYMPRTRQFRDSRGIASETRGELDANFGTWANNFDPKKV
jgi:hypothetical protein